MINKIRKRQKHSLILWKNEWRENRIPKIKCGYRYTKPVACSTLRYRPSSYMWNEIYCGIQMWFQILSPNLESNFLTILHLHVLLSHFSRVLRLRYLVFNCITIVWNGGWRSIKKKKDLKNQARLTQWYACRKEILMLVTAEPWRRTFLSHFLWIIRSFIKNEWNLKGELWLPLLAALLYLSDGFFITKKKTIDPYLAGHGMVTWTSSRIYMERWDIVLTGSGNKIISTL